MGIAKKGRLEISTCIWEARIDKIKGQILNPYGVSGFSGLEWWNGMVEWTGMEWNGNKLDTSDWFSPSYNDHL